MAGAGLCKMVITGYEDPEYKKLISPVFTVQLNPSSIQRTRGINYSEDKVLGTGSTEAKYTSHKGDQLTFKILMDDTGVLSKGVIEETINDRLGKMYKTLYTLNSETHEPNYVIITWGSFSFQGRVSSLSEEYTLFAPDGSPLRMTVSLTFVSHTAKEETKKSDGNLSPDLTREITLKAGETIAWWCEQLYRDPSYCLEIAAYNRLNGFRNVKPGTSLIFPPLKRYGNISGKR